ncbi:hypothetical protein LWC34_38815 [Kibdelosporangium philippinense]|uniref:Uncharacterized protein n=2 Tax=Kibdelosporangium philippinense TaxID=211113 RepID=A0ABS8ZMH5_9PSEU|nr:hypothetical protein [Kibdelosporangium philippinense]MCE7008722.1 hypothetical protein [Kibdelosporangium philippinense]
MPNFNGPTGLGTMHCYVCPDRMEINSNGMDQRQARGWIVDSWNRQTPEDPPVTLDDFDFRPAPADFGYMW